ncbi:ABC transporter ATP-binding protein [Marisediminicola senii]|uniref:ABC transporter ATP-binding protein n=1 Tax=Marisediminicola senii TaxID=2711233 RepID=UPI0013EA0BAF|nr:ATP-binding cassette domain-containing protein [Marisediminicola senii]
MITAENLTKRYGNRLAVDDVSFTARPGRITGFLGPNGAGKSTTMRMLSALATPTSGTSTVLGVPFGALTNPGRHVGILLDAGAQHPGRTGRESLAISSQLMGMPPERVDDVLDIVGLTAKEGRARIRGYSLGMRQRLGLASALLGDPSVLILDEPANGLDPAGIRWMRGLLSSFAAAGGTVLLSSHLLLEVEAIADDLIIIGDGKVLAQGSAADLLAAPGTEVHSLDDAALQRALVAAGFEVTVTASGLTTSATVDDVGRLALASGVVVTDLHPAATAGLESLFFSMTAQHGREDVSA